MNPLFGKGQPLYIKVSNPEKSLVPYYQIVVLETYVDQQGGFHYQVKTPSGKIHVVSQDHLLALQYHKPTGLQVFNQQAQQNLNPVAPNQGQFQNVQGQPAMVQGQVVQNTNPQFQQPQSLNNPAQAPQLNADNPTSGM